MALEGLLEKTAKQKGFCEGVEFICVEREKSYKVGEITVINNDEEIKILSNGGVIFNGKWAKLKEVKPKISIILPGLELITVTNNKKEGTIHICDKHGNKTLGEKFVKVLRCLYLFESLQFNDLRINLYQNGILFNDEFFITSEEIKNFLNE